jgi:PAS domain S-box-containing protein
VRLIVLDLHHHHRPPDVSFRRAASEFLFGVIGIASITLAALRIHPWNVRPEASVGPGTISLVYLVVVVFVSLRAGFVYSSGVSLIAACCLNYFFLPLFPALQVRNPLDIVATAVFLLTAWVITGMVARLRREHALLDGLFEHAPLALALVNIDNRVVRVNEAFTEVFGYAPQETAGHTLTELIVPHESRDTLQNQVELVSQRGRVDAEVIRRRKDGTQLHVFAVGAPVSVPDGQVLVYDMYCDIDDRKAAEVELEALSIRLLNLQETERNHLARELHDEIGQLLTYLSWLLGPNADSLGGTIKSRSEDARTIVDDLLARVQRISFDLRPVDLDESGLLPALLALFERYTVRTGIQVNFIHRGIERRFAPEVETGAYRVVQEALTNVARHAGVSGITVRASADTGKLNLEIKDGGRGFDPEVVLKAPRSSGLIGMRERIKLLGGRMAIQSSPGAGTTITAELPLDKFLP